MKAKELRDLTSEELMNKLLNGIVNYFYDLLKQNKKKFKKFNS